jgi:hypothetical protein
MTMTFKPTAHTSPILTCRGFIIPKRRVNAISPDYWGKKKNPTIGNVIYNYLPFIVDVIFFYGEDIELYESVSVRYMYTYK